jgi:ABC-type sugar transport system ATPase subunit
VKVADAMRLGIALVPEDRKQDALIGQKDSLAERQIGVALLFLKR